MYPRVRIERRDKVIRELALIYLGIIIGTVAAFFIKGTDDDEEG